MIVRACPRAARTASQGESHRNGEAAHGEVAVLRLLAGRLGELLLGLQGAADRTRLLRTKVERHVLLALVLFSGLLLLLLVVHREDPCDGLPDNLDLGQL